MSMKKTVCALICATSVMSTPVMAQSLSPSARLAATSPVKRVGPAVKKESKQMGGSTVIYVLVALALIGGIILLTDDDGPSSP